MWVIFLFLAIASGEIALRSHRSEKDLAEFTEKVYRKFCPEGKTTLVIHHEQDVTPDIFMHTLAKTGYNMSILTFNVQKRIIFGGKYDGVRADLTIIFARSSKEDGVSLFVNIVRKIPAFHSFTKLLVVFTSPIQPGSWIPNAFRFLWKFQVMRIFFAFWDEDIKIFTYNPFRGDYQIDISNCTDEKLKFYFEFELFDLYGYPMRVHLWDRGSYRDRVQEKIDPTGHIDYLGYDGKLLTQVRDILNVTLDLFKESEIEIVGETSISNPTLRGGKFLTKHNLDIRFTAVRARSYIDADHLFLHERDDYVIIVPKGEKIPDYLYIFRTISPTLWLVMSALALLCTFLLSVIRKFYKCNKSSFLDSYTDICRHSLTIPIEQYNDNTPERILLNSLMMFAMVYIAAFNSSLVSALVVPKFLPDINKIDELVRTNMTVWTTSYDYTMMETTLQGKDLRLLNNLRVGDSFNSKNMLRYQNKSGFLTRFERAREFLKLSKKFGKIR